MSNTLARNRAKAYAAQQGRCFYCQFHMWSDHPEDFAAFHRITLKQAMHFQCTAEHLIARQDGGTDAASNIVAACIRCNQLRHAREYPLDAIRFRAWVERRLARGAWQTVCCIRLR